MSLGLLRRLMSTLSSSTSISISSSSSSSTSAGPPGLKAVVAVLERFASSSLAEKWDNVGLLLEPSPPHSVRTLLLTNDLTEEVLEEALALGAELVVSYHPPLFSAVKRLTQQAWKDRVLIRALEHRVALYSPHTAWDQVPGGINDWLLSAFKDHISKVEVVYAAGGASVSRVHTRVASSSLGEVRARLARCDATLLFATHDPDSGECKLEISAGRGGVARLLEAGIGRELGSPLEQVELTALPSGDPLLGGGRIATFAAPVPVQHLVRLVKLHLGLPHLRLALGTGVGLEKGVSRVGVCAGSGASVLAKCKNRVDLFLSGEMSHHEVLDFTQQGGTVILCEHSNTERGFLGAVVQPHLRAALPDLKVLVSKADHDPLSVL